MLTRVNLFERRAKVSLSTQVTEQRHSHVYSEEPQPSMRGFLHHTACVKEISLWATRPFFINHWDWNCAAKDRDETDNRETVVRLSSSRPSPAHSARVVQNGIVSSVDRKNPYCARRHRSISDARYWEMPDEISRYFKTSRYRSIYLYFVSHTTVLYSPKWQIQNIITIVSRKSQIYIDLREEVILPCCTTCEHELSIANATK